MCFVMSRGPMLWSLSFTHDPDKTDARITAAIDEVIEDIRSRPVAQADLDRARTKLRSQLYGEVESQGKLGLVDLFAVYALFDNDPGAVNRIEEGFAKVSPADLQRVAREYLRPDNRSIYTVTPAPKTAAAAGDTK